MRAEIRPRNIGRRKAIEEAIEGLREREKKAKGSKKVSMPKTIQEAWGRCAEEVGVAGDDKRIIVKFLREYGMLPIVGEAIGGKSRLIDHGGFVESPPPVEHVEKPVPSPTPPHGAQQVWRVAKECEVSIVDPRYGGKAVTHTLVKGRKIVVMPHEKKEEKKAERKQESERA